MFWHNGNIYMLEWNSMLESQRRYVTYVDLKRR